MKKCLIMPLLGLALTLGSSCGSNEQKDSTEVAKDSNESKVENNKVEDDMDFLVNAASGGLLEVALGKLAQQNASSASIKEFGQHMISDHSRANEELKAIATRRKFAIPATPGEKHQKMIDELSGKKGADFDKAYAKMMVDDHQEDIKEFQKEAETGNDVDLKAFATSTLPTLQHHLQMITAINDSVKK